MVIRFRKHYTCQRQRSCVVYTILRCNSRNVHARAQTRSHTRTRKLWNVLQMREIHDESFAPRWNFHSSCSLDSCIELDVLISANQKRASYCWIITRVKIAYYYVQEQISAIMWLNVFLITFLWIVSWKLESSTQSVYAWKITFFFKFIHIIERSFK